MSWRVEFSKTGERDFAVLDRSQRREIIKRLEWLVANFEQATPLPLHAEWRGFFKLRLGDWRIIYRFDQPKSLITVHVIDHRSKIYKRHSR